MVDRKEWPDLALLSQLYHPRLLGLLPTFPLGATWIQNLFLYVKYLDSTAFPYCMLHSPARLVRGHTYSPGSIYSQRFSHAISQNLSIKNGRIPTKQATPERCLLFPKMRRRETFFRDLNAGVNLPEKFNRGFSFMLGVYMSEALHVPSIQAMLAGNCNPNHPIEHTDLVIATEEAKRCKHLVDNRSTASSCRGESFLDAVKRLDAKPELLDLDTEFFNSHAWSPSGLRQYYRLCIDTSFWKQANLYNIDPESIQFLCMVFTGQRLCQCHMKVVWRLMGNFSLGMQKVSEDGQVLEAVRHFWSPANIVCLARTRQS
ncbi:hypothetical protein SELMODRAFT_404511 [Selaginella moellendorffii]|uniref:Uncharacterized protein n=1 Tax=Selaginella moellendorffii TaxID=88036 RepID=D8QVK3_SELML|nr:hypothetical protein SELMODRAFT_404511 [Selaginella moellendorffii]